MQIAPRLVRGFFFDAGGRLRPLTYSSSATTIDLMRANRALADEDPDVDANLLAAGHEVEALVLEIEALRALWPKGETATRRAQIVRKINLANRRLAELYGVIATAEAHTLAGAIVKLRRGLALMDTMPIVDELKTAKQMIESALAAIEGMPRDPQVPDSPSP